MTFIRGYLEIRVLINLLEFNYILNGKFKLNYILKNNSTVKNF